MLVLLGILIVALYKGCVRYRSVNNDNVNMRWRIDQLLADSASTAKKLADNSIESFLLNGQIELINNKNEMYLDSFGNLNKEITYLRGRYKPIAPSVDTSVTTVPNEYIEDCAGCFDRLGKAQQLGIRYKAELDNKDQVYASKINVLNKRVGILEKHNEQLGKSYRSLLDSVPVKSDIRRTLFLTMGVMAINTNMPNAIGGGLMYEDKRRRIFGAKAYISKYGNVYQADVSFPLSLRIK